MERFIVVDLETTGHSVETDHIIEIGVVIIENGQISESYSTFIHPKQSIPPFITSLTGITDEDVRDAPSFEDVAPKIVDLFSHGYFVAHNVAFDLRFLNTKLEAVQLKKLTNPVIDTVELARILFPQAPSFQLEQLAEYLGIHHDEAHRALADAHMTAEMLLQMRYKLYTLPYETIHHLINLETVLISDLHIWLEQRKKELAFSIAEPADDIVSYRGLAFKHRPFKDEREEVLKLPFMDYLDHIYEANGTMEQYIPNYEKRSGQRHMSEMIFDAFQMHHHALIEAETGTGKSLAYLIPAIYEALQKKQRIVISTHTTQLQSQLLEEEIPLLRKLIPSPFTVALLKGKQHYLSLENFARELSLNKQDNYDVALTKAIILIWLTETETGDIDEIQLPPSGYYFFHNVSTEAEGPVHPSSPWFRYSYYQKARQKAQKAHILITNHALLCTDMFNDYSLLPSYERVIIDEAHHFEHIASHHYGYKLDYVSMLYVINQIGQSTNQGFIMNMITRHPSLIDSFSMATWDELHEEATYELDELFRMLFQYVMSRQTKQSSLSDTGRIQHRLDEDRKHEKEWTVILEMATRLTFYLRDLIHLLSSCQQQLDDENDQNQATHHMESLQGFIDDLEHFFLCENSSTHVKWIEIDAYGAKNSVYLYSEPAYIADRLAEDFFTNKQSVILTSATLTMRNSFSFMQDRLGISSIRLMTEQIASPFEYDKQAKLLIPNDFPNIHSDDFIYSTCEAILSLANITDGRMLVLFTSYDMLKKSYNLLQETMDADEYVLIAQGISSGSRSRLKKNFQKFEKSILLGTSSFWEGIDIPGKDLSCLMIVRLPFQRPNHPVFEAKAQFLKEQGKNPFFELSLPQAVIRFKQGFGRLIRSTRDRGIVFVCDARIKKAKYGTFFLDSIPEVPILYGSTYELLDEAKRWF